MKLAHNFASAVALTTSILLSIDSPARANTPAPVFGTGVGSTPGGRDANWKVVAGPDSFIPPAPYPYAAYTLLDAPAYSPGGGEPQAGEVINGIRYYWMGPTSDSGVAGGLPAANWILAQEFTVATADTYQFGFLAGADNALALYLGGNIVANGDSPDIQSPIASLGGTANTFGGTLGQISASIFLAPNTYTLYALLQNAPTTGPTGFFLANNNTNDVPAPLPLFGAAAAFGASRRLKRRIRLARLSVSTKAG